MAESKDKINHPAHYAGKIETIDYIIKALDIAGATQYCQGNIIKYVSRYKKKNGIEDLKKAKWYLEKIIEINKLEETDLGIDLNLLDYIEGIQSKEGVQGYYFGEILEYINYDVDLCVLSKFYLDRLIKYLEENK